jgi:hypothetical protein
MIGNDVVTRIENGICILQKGRTFITPSAENREDIF